MPPLHGNQRSLRGLDVLGDAQVVLDRVPAVDVDGQIACLESDLLEGLVDSRLECLGLRVGRAYRWLGSFSSYNAGQIETHTHSVFTDTHLSCPCDLSWDLSWDLS
jgi:hypothetical protein